MKVIEDTVYLKLVFFGTALAGKTTILEWLFNNAIPDDLKAVDTIRQVKTSFGQTLLFDFAPVYLADGVIARIFTATGQDYYAGTRPQILKNADGIFLVIDSQKVELEHNREFVAELHQHMENIEELSDAEIVVLFNKQDMQETYSPDFLTDELGLANWPSYSSSAVKGENLKEALLEMLTRLSHRLEKEGISLA